MELYKSQKGENDIYWKLVELFKTKQYWVVPQKQELTIVVSAYLSLALTCMENYENSPAMHKGYNPMIHFLIKL